MNTVATQNVCPRNVRALVRVAALALCSSVAAGCVLAGAPAAYAQAAPRSLEGTVMGNGGTALSGAVVYLKNTNTLAIKTYVADGSGAFRFGQIGNEGDYQVWAEYGGRKSNIKTVSALDSKKQVTVALKIDTSK